ncbi:ABC transporter permease [Candidatus Poribacteria bacterium]|nr:ABC transporter permease [Candidatus Poribacteria bacterium]
MWGRGKLGYTVSAAFTFLLAIHLLVYPHLMDWGMNLVHLCANLFFLAHGFIWSSRLKRFKWSIYLAGYLSMFVLLVVYADRPLLFPLLVILYAASFRLPRLIGYLAIFVLSVLFLTPYWIQSLIVLSLLYSVLLGVGRERVRFHLVAFLIGFILLSFILFPLLYLLFQSSPQTLAATLNQEKFRGALYTSLATATVTTLISLLFGVPLAYSMVRMGFRGRRAVESLLSIPILTPHTIVGIALLVMLGPKAPVGEFIRRTFGVSIAGSYFGIVAAQVYVSSPYLVFSAMNGFHSVDPKLEKISRSLGASPLKTFFKVSLPLAAPAIFEGCVMTWSRALSEMGSLMVLAYHPFTISTFTYDVFTQYGLSEAQPVAILFLIICLWIFILLRWIREQHVGMIPVFRFSRF